VRVIAGTAKGRRLAAPPAGTRPTSDRVREALFSALQAHLPRAQVLDLFAGSGAVGIEALSRGAAAATFVERSPPAHRTIVENLGRVGFTDRSRVIHRDVVSALRHRLDDAPFDIVFADPPYTLTEAALTEVLELVAPLLSPDATVIIERSRRSPEPTWPSRLRPGRTRRYGETVLYEARAVGAGGVQLRDEGDA
jgi:16S rRNA (guanine966-N2)-methyltransferase